MRSFAIINLRKEIDIYQNIIQQINDSEKIFIFTIFDNFVCNIESDNITIITIPNEYTDSEAKIKNYVTKYFIENNFKGFLHVIEDSVEIFNSPEKFVNELEIMMNKLKLKSWFNTITDKLNFTFNIYNPRFSIVIDEPEFKEKYDKIIHWTSHANTSWVCYNLEQGNFSDFEFDERFKIPMFYIIKFLADRRNQKQNGEMYYMNFYPSIDEEKDVFRLLRVKDFIEITAQDKNNEHNLFNSLNVNYSQDNIIEPIFEDMIFNLRR